MSRFLALLLLLLVAAAPEAAERRGDRDDPSRPRNGHDLIRRLALGPVVVVARVDRVGTRMDLSVEQILRGRNIPRQLTVAFRAANVGRSQGAPPFVAVEGERAVFVLDAPKDERGDDRSGTLRPAGGFQGRIPIPAEGADALLDAIRELVMLQDDAGAWASDDRLAEWLAGSNPWLIDAALDFVARLGLADRDTVPGLLERARDLDPDRRASVAEALGTALARGRVAPRTRAGTDAEDDDIARAARETVVRLARTDPDPRVRRVAVRQLGKIATGSEREILAAIARDDASHDVRYEAAAALAGPDR